MLKKNEAWFGLDGPDPLVSLALNEPLAKCFAKAFDSLKGSGSARVQTHQARAQLGLKKLGPFHLQLRLHREVKARYLKTAGF